MGGNEKHCTHRAGGLVEPEKRFLRGKRLYIDKGKHWRVGYWWNKVQDTAILWIGMRRLDMTRILNWRE